MHGNQPPPRCLILRARFWNQPTANQPQFQGDILDLDFEGPCAMCMGTNRHPATTQVPPPWRKILEKCSRFRFWGQQGKIVFSVHGEPPTNWASSSVGVDSEEDSRECEQFWLTICTICLPDRGPFFTNC